MANYQAPDGVRVYKVNLNGSQFTNINIEDGIINKRQGVVLRSSTSSVTLTKTYSKSSDDYSNNSLIGTDYQITNPGNAYVFNYKQSHGLSFYPLSSKGKIKANAAYLIMIFTYLTQWKIVGNSQVHTDPYLTSWKVSGNSVVDNNTILSCGDLGQDGKYHVKISNGVTIYDIPLDAPLRKINNVADTIEFPSDTEGKALVTRSISATGIDNEINAVQNGNSQYRWLLKADAKTSQNSRSANVLSNKYSTITANQTWLGSSSGVAIDNSGKLLLFDLDYTESTDKAALVASNVDTVILYELATPTTELVDAPQIEEAESYSCVISQGGKAVSWSNFETE